MSHVTIPDQDSYITYPSETGTGPYTVPFAIFEKADITVLVGGVDIGQSGFSYTATSSTTGGYQTGTITLAVAAAAQDVTIYRDINPKRTSDMGPGPQARDALNSALDRTHAMHQDARRDRARTLRMPIGDNVDELSGGTAGQVLGLGATGQPSWISIVVSGALSLASGWASALATALGAGWAVHLGKKMPRLYAADYGVDAGNSAAANYTAIEDLIDAITAAGRCKVIVPAGDIYTLGGHNPNSSYQTWQGAGGINRATRFITTQANTIMTLGDGTTLTNDYKFKGIGWGGPAGATAIWQRYVQNVYIEDFSTAIDRFLRLGDATAAGAAYRTHIKNGEGTQVASSSLLSHIKFEWHTGEYKRHNVNFEGQRQANTIGTDFASNKNNATVDGIKWKSSYEGRFDIGVDHGATRLTNCFVIGNNFEGAGRIAWNLDTSVATGGFGSSIIRNNIFGTDAQDGAWAASPVNPVYISVDNASVSIDGTVFADNVYSDVSRTTLFYMECLAGVIDGCRFGGITWRGVMKDAAQYLCHIKGAPSGSATITNSTVGSAQGKSFTNALAGGVLYEGKVELPAPEMGKVPSTVSYFIDNSHTVPIEQAVRITFVNTAGTMQHKMTDILDDAAAAPVDKVARFTATSTSLQNTPTATDSSTAMVGGGKIASADASRFILDLIAGQVSRECEVLSCDVVANTTDTADIFFQPVFLNSNVNGVTQIRLVLEQRRGSDGGTLGINTSNYDAGELVSVNLRFRAR